MGQGRGRRQQVGALKPADYPEWGGGGNVTVMARGVRRRLLCVVESRKRGVATPLPRDDVRTP